MLYHTVFMQEVQSMKRTLCLLSALLLVAFWFTPTRALAEEESVLISAALASGEMGAEADVPLLMDRCIGVDSVQLDVNYDSAALEFVSMTPGDLFAAQYTIANADTPGRIRIACASALGLEGAGTLLTLRFRLLSEAGSAVVITSGAATRVDADYNQSTAFIEIENGGITVGEAPLPSPAVTPWVPATPIPTPSPTPESTATPQQTQAPLQTNAQTDALSTPGAAAPSFTNLNPAVYLVGGGLIVAVIALVVILLSRKKKG